MAQKMNRHPRASAISLPTTGATIGAIDMKTRITEFRCESSLPE